LLFDANKDDDLTFDAAHGIDSRRAHTGEAGELALRPFDALSPFHFVIE
jgi:hypothetical protein